MISIKKESCGRNSLEVSPVRILLKSKALTFSGLLYWQIAVEKIELPAWENIDGLVFPKAAVPLNKKTGLLPKSIRNQGPEISSGTGFQLKASAKAFIPSTLDRSLSNPGVAVRAEGRTIRYHYSWPSSRPSLAWGLELRTTIQPGMTDSPPKDPDSTYSSPPTENSQKPEVVGMPSEKLPVAWRRALERMKWDEYGSRLRGLELDQWRKLLYRHFKRVEVFSMTNEEIASWRKVFKGEYFAFGTTLDDVTFTTRAHPRHSPGALPENCRTSTLGAHCSGCASTMGIWKPFQRG